MIVAMSAHHEATIQRLKQAYENDPDCLALIIGGSVAKGWAKENSDVDFMAIVTDERFELSRDTLTIYRTDLTDYEGGYVDGKLVPLRLVHMVAEKGSEPARSAYLGARVLFDRTGEVESLIKRILVYPEEGVEERIRRFHSQLMIWAWFVGEAAKRDDRYLMSRATTEIALFAMRIVLAVNRRIYPYHKWVTRMVEETPDKPDGIVEKVHAMLRAQTFESAKAVVDALQAWRDIPIDYREHCNHFLEDSEWNWLEGPAPIGDR
jgi:predicted nucleotidyltransferase